MEIKMSVHHKNRIKYAGYGHNVFKAYEDAVDKITIQIGSAFLQGFTNTVSYLCIKGGKADAVLFCKCAAELRFKNLTENMFSMNEIGHSSIVSWATSFVLLCGSQACRA